MSYSTPLSYRNCGLIGLMSIDFCCEMVWGNLWSSQISMSTWKHGSTAAGGVMVWGRFTWHALWALLYQLSIVQTLHYCWPCQSLYYNSIPFWWLW